LEIKPTVDSHAVELALKLEKLSRDPSNWVLNMAAAQEECQRNRDRLQSLAGALFLLLGGMILETLAKEGQGISRTTRYRE
jgi:hypothetical protein